ncbi:unnamed protein product, partial [Menidia menidia]
MVFEAKSLSGRIVNRDYLVCLLALQAADVTMDITIRLLDSLIEVLLQRGRLSEYSDRDILGGKRGSKISILMLAIINRNLRHSLGAWFIIRILNCIPKFDGIESIPDHASDFCLCKQVL